MFDFLKGKNIAQKELEHRAVDFYLNNIVDCKDENSAGEIDPDDLKLYLKCINEEFDENSVKKFHKKINKFAQIANSNDAELYKGIKAYYGIKLKKQFENEGAITQLRDTLLNFKYCNKKTNSAYKKNFDSIFAKEINEARQNDYKQLIEDLYKDFKDNFDDLYKSSNEYIFDKKANRIYSGSSFGKKYPKPYIVEYIKNVLFYGKKDIKSLEVGIKRIINESSCINKKFLLENFMRPYNIVFDYKKEKENDQMTGQIEVDNRNKFYELLSNIIDFADYINDFFNEKNLLDKYLEDTMNIVFQSEKGIYATDTHGMKKRKNYFSDVEFAYLFHLISASNINDGFKNQLLNKLYHLVPIDFIDRNNLYLSEYMYSGDRRTYTHDEVEFDNLKIAMKAIRDEATLNFNYINTPSKDSKDNLRFVHPISIIFERNHFYMITVLVEPNDEAIMEVKYKNPVSVEYRLDKVENLKVGKKLEIHARNTVNETFFSGNRYSDYAYGKNWKNKCKYVKCNNDTIYSQLTDKVSYSYDERSEKKRELILSNVMDNLTILEPDRSIVYTYVLDGKVTLGNSVIMIEIPRNSVSNEALKYILFTFEERFGNDFFCNKQYLKEFEERNRDVLKCLIDNSIDEDGYFLSPVMRYTLSQFVCDGIRYDSKTEEMLGISRIVQNEKTERIDQSLDAKIR